MNGGENGRPFFLDTNVLLYAFFDTDARKRRLSEQVVQDALLSRRGIISAQVVQESLNVVLRKPPQPMRIDDAREYLRTILAPLWRHQPSVAFYDLALRIRQETGYAYYDSLIVAAALESDCDTLLTEDMQHGRVLQGLRIVNPFLPDAGWPGAQGTNG